MYCIVFMQHVSSYELTAEFKANTALELCQFACVGLYKLSTFTVLH